MTIENATETPENMIAATARGWVLRLSESDDPALTTQCAAWRDAAPAHDDAFWAAWKAWNALAETEIAKAGSWRDEIDGVRAEAEDNVIPMRRGRFWRAAVPTALAASLLLAFLLYPAAPGPSIEIATRTAENRAVELADGSKVTVGGKSTLVASVGEKARRVELKSGQAFFEVAHDPSRPFTVVAGDAEVIVRGTKFDVRFVNGEVSVNVLEGRVEVRKRGVLSWVGVGGSADAVLNDGQHSELRPGAAFEAAAPAKVAAGDWIGGRLYYIDAPLSEILDDAQRYTDVKLRYEGAEVGALPLTASFRGGDVDALESYIEDTLPVEVRRSGNEMVVRAR